MFARVVALLICLLASACNTVQITESPPMHGALTASTGAAREAGLLAAVRSVELAVTRLDDLPDAVHLRVQRVAANPQGRIYRFEARAGERLIGSGSLVIIVEC